MKIPKLLKKVEHYIDADKKKQCKQRDSMREVLKQLKKKQRLLREKQDSEKDDKKRKHIQKDLDIIFVQRKKGLKALKKLQDSCR